MKKYSGLRNTERIDLAASIPLTAPLTLFIDPCGECNLRCGFCPQSTIGFHASGTMPMSDFERIAAQAREMGGVKVVNLYGFGEPLLNPDTPEMLALARTFAERVTLTTNGTLLTGDVARAVVAAAPDYVRVSANSRAVLDNVREFCAIPGRPFVYVKGVGWLPEVPEADECACETRHYWNGPGLVGNKVVCPSPFYTLVIHADLKVSPCCVDWNRLLIVGDLANMTLEQVWTGDALAELQAVHLRGERSTLIPCGRCSNLYLMPDDLDRLLGGRKAACLQVGAWRGCVANCERCSLA
jgi:MoaA/NifB/PqqE/SkfB family radical SAM enzyme